MLPYLDAVRMHEQKQNTGRFSTGKVELCVQMALMGLNYVRSGRRVRITTHNVLELLSTRTFLSCTTMS